MQRRRSRTERKNTYGGGRRAGLKRVPPLKNVRYKYYICQSNVQELRQSPRSAQTRDRLEVINNNVSAILSRASETRQQPSKFRNIMEKKTTLKRVAVFRTY